MADSCFECEYRPGEELVFRFRPMGLKLLGPAGRGHLRKAAREALLSLRSLIDAGVESLEEEGKEKKSSRRPRKIDVQ